MQVTVKLDPRKILKNPVQIDPSMILQDPIEVKVEVDISQAVGKAVRAILPDFLERLLMSTRNVRMENLTASTEKPGADDNGKGRALALSTFTRVLEAAQDKFREEEAMSQEDDACLPPVATIVEEPEASTKPSDYW